MWQGCGAPCCGASPGWAWHRPGLERTGGTHVGRGALGGEEGRSPWSITRDNVGVCRKREGVGGAACVPGRTASAVQCSPYHRHCHCTTATEMQGRCMGRQAYVPVEPPNRCSSCCCFVLICQTPGAGRAVLNSAPSIARLLLASPAVLQVLRRAHGFVPQRAVAQCDGHGAGRHGAHGRRGFPDAGLLAPLLGGEHN